MKIRPILRTIALTAVLGAGHAAFAQVSFNIQIGPPAPLYEAVPVLAPGYVWAPGYWAWHGDRHVWVRGRSMYQRVGYRWEPDMWEQRSTGYYRHPGRWEREDGPSNGRGHDNGNGKFKKDKKNKKDKKHED